MPKANMIDCLVVTFIREEYEAVCRQFLKSHLGAPSGTPGATRVTAVSTRSGRRVNVALGRVAKEGNISALDGVLDLIAEQHPRLVLAVGIAGAVPTSDIFLGDVLLVNEIHDMTRGAETTRGREEATAGSYLENAVKEFVANVTMDDVREWQEQMTSITRPRVEGIGNSWTKDETWNGKINRVLEKNKDRSLPKVVDGVIASSDRLVKSQAFMKRRLLVDRGILANDMESAGVAKACERKNTPLLVIRGVSDLVGHERSDDWKLYACETAAGCARELLTLDCIDTIEQRMAGGQSGLSERAKGVIRSLDGALAQVRTGGAIQYASTCREAFELFKQLPEELQRRWGPELFGTLDRPMKYLGDKGLVLEVAKACIACCNGEDMDATTAECEARARICGTSWVYQRTGNLGLAEEEAKKSLQISEGLGSSENLAFCYKCLGRLKRLRAEEETNATVRRTRFDESVKSLNQAISAFGDLSKYGPDDPEVGDCYSLLGRTYLNSGDIRSAQKCAVQARQRIDGESKDYLDLLILEGNIRMATRAYEQALAAFEEVINRTDHDYQISEIVARAHRERAEVLMRLSRYKEAGEAFEAARTIWAHYKEDNLAAGAEWGGILAAGFLGRRTIRLLEREKPVVRCLAVKLYRERQLTRSSGVVAQRIGADDTVWKRLVKEAKQLQVLRSRSE